jgi:hypothetical protein
LLTEHPAKNCDTLADIVPVTNEQQLQGLVTQMIWDETALNQRRVMPQLMAKCTHCHVQHIRLHIDLQARPLKHVADTLQPRRA